MMRVVAMVCVLMASACASGGVRQAHQQESFYALRQRASYDFRCPPEQLTFVPLDQRANGWVFLFGVEGCGYRSSYSLIPQHYTGQWYPSGSSAEWQAAQAAEAARRQQLLHVPPPPMMR